MFRHWILPFIHWQSTNLPLAGPVIHNQYYFYNRMENHILALRMDKSKLNK